MYGDFLLQNYLWVQTSTIGCLVAMILLGNDGDDERSSRQWLGPGDEYQSQCPWKVCLKISDCNITNCVPIIKYYFDKDGLGAVVVMVVNNFGYIGLLG